MACGRARCWRHQRHAKYATAAAPIAPASAQSHQPSAGIGTGALISRISPVAAFVAAALVGEAGAGMMTADEFVFIFTHAAAVFPASQKTGPARWHKVGRFAIESSRSALRETAGATPPAPGPGARRRPRACERRRC